MDRRTFLNFGALPIATTVIAACGGGELGGDYEIDRAMDASKLASVPEAIPVDLAFLSEEVESVVNASVVLGSEPQVGVTVNFYDVSGTFIGSSVTNDAGMAESGLKARRVVVAEAHTAQGVLLGMRVYGGLEFMPVLHVDVLQSVFVKVIEKLANSLNVSAYVLQDYFRVPQSMNVLNIRHDHTLLDQRLAYAEWQQSGQSIEAYVDHLVADIVDHIEDDGHINLRFNSEMRETGLQGRLGSIEEDLVDGAGKMVIDLIDKAIPIPFLSPLFEFAFGQFTNNFFAKDDPFAAVMEKLGALQDAIDKIEDLIKELQWSNARLKIAEKFSVFVNVNEDLKKLHDALNARSRDEGNIKYLLEVYENSVKALTADSKARDNLREANRMFFGQQEFVQGGGIDVFLNLLQNRKFYSRISEDQYRTYLGYFLTYQALGYLLLAASHMVRHKDDPSQESHVSNALRSIKQDLDAVSKQIASIDVAILPERVNIDHQNKLAWIGSCGLIGNIREFWPPNRDACADKPLPPGIVCEKGSGLGLIDWQGPDPERQLNNSPIAPTRDTIDFGIWRNPSEKEFRDSFFDEARSRGLKVDVYAAERGFSCYSDKLKMELKPFSNYPDNKSASINNPLAAVSTRYRRAGRAGGNGANYYLDCTSFDLIDNSAHSNAVMANHVYKGKRYAFFPTCVPKESQLESHLPWRKVAAARVAKII